MSDFKGHIHECQNCHKGIAHSDGDAIQDCEQFIVTVSEICRQYDDARAEVAQEHS